VSGAGYQLPTPITVAPGQVITFFVQGIGLNLTGPVYASETPLPTTLAGISATLKQVNPDRAGPVLAVQPISTCSGPPRTGCGRYTGVTVQLPFEMLADNPDTPLGTLIGGARLVFSENGVAIPEVELDTLVDQIHILRMCDLLYAKPGYDCSPVATHRDGSIIGVDHPAKAGEEIVLYAFGLGNTMPTVPTGAAPTAPAPVFLPFRASFDPRSNAAPSKPPASSPAPLFDGVTPGFVGLYQINVQVPRLPPGSPACSPSLVPIGSNLTVNVAGPASFDGAAICVQPEN